MSTFFLFLGRGGELHCYLKSIRSILSLRNILSLRSKLEAASQAILDSILLSLVLYNQYSKSIAFESESAKA